MALFSLNQIVSLLQAYGYGILFPIAVIEGPIVTIIAGFLSAHGLLLWQLALVVVIVGDLVGDALYYIIGRWSGRKIINKWGRHFGIEEREIKKIEEHFKKHPGKTLLIGKWTQVAGMPILLTAGISRMKFWLFMEYSFVGTIVKSTIFFTIGYFAGEAYKRVNSYLDAIGFVSTIVTILIIVYLIYRGQIKKSKIINTKN